MPQIVGIKFNKTPKIYYFEAGDHAFTEGGGVIVETSRGVEYGTVARYAEVRERQRGCRAA